MTNSTTPAVMTVMAVLAGVMALAPRLRAEGPGTGDDPAQDNAQARPRTRFEYPCEDYRRGLRGKGNFGVHITRKGTPFSGSYHLAEDVWLPAGTEVRSVSDGLVRYSDFSPTWTDDGGFVHWNLGNVLVIEHALEPAEDDLAAVCSVYVHLGADRRVGVGERVTRGQVVGTIGADRSEENGRYPVHLHFGLHRGPYFQISPAWRRDLVESARTTGIRLGENRLLRGDVEITRQSETSVLVRFPAQGESMVLSLLVGSTFPGTKPADIMGWCQGYGDRGTVDEWLRPSTWIAAHFAAD